MNDHLSIEDLSALLDDVLPAASRERAFAHLATCAACRAELEAWRETVELVRAAPLRPLPEGADLRLPTSLLAATPQASRSAPARDGFREAPESMHPPRRSQVLLRLPRYSLLAAGTLAAAVVLAVGIRLGQGSMGAPVPAAQSVAVQVADESEGALALAPAAALEQPAARSAADAAPVDNRSPSEGMIAFDAEETGIEEPAVPGDAEAVPGGASAAVAEEDSATDEYAAYEYAADESAEGSTADEDSAVEESVTETGASQDEAEPAYEDEMAEDDAPEAGADTGSAAGRPDDGSAGQDATQGAEPSVVRGLPGSAWLALLALAVGFLGVLAFLFLRPRG